VLCCIDNGKASEAMAKLAAPDADEASCRGLAHAYLLSVCGRMDAFGKALKEAIYPPEHSLVARAMEARWLDAVGDTAAAREACREIMEESPKSPFVLRRVLGVCSTDEDWELRRRIRGLVARRGGLPLSTDPFGDILVALCRIDAAFDPENAYKDDRKRYVLLKACKDFRVNASALQSVAAALFYRDLTEPSLAQRVYDQAAGLLPGLRVKSELATLAQFQGNAKEAARLRREQLRDEPESVSAHTGVIRDLLGQEFAREAIGMCEDAMANCGRETALLLLMAECAAKTGNGELVAELIREAMGVGNLAGRNFSTAAGLLMACGERDLASQLVDARRPGDPHGMVSAAAWLLETDRPDEAVAQIVAAFELAPSLEKTLPGELLDPLCAHVLAAGGEGVPPAFVRHLGVSLAYNQRTSEALRLVRLALEQGDRSAEAFKHAIGLSAGLGNVGLAIESALAAVAEGRLTEESLSLLWGFLLPRGDRRSVRAVLDELATLPNLEDELAPAVVAGYKQVLDDIEGGLSFLESRCTDESSLCIFDALAELLVDKKYYARSAEVCRQGLVKYPGDARLLGRLSLALERIGRSDESLEYCRQSLAADPGFDWAVRKMVGHHVAALELAKARSVYRKAVAAAPAAKDLRREFAQFLLEHFNDAAAASAQIEEALLADPENAELQKKLERYRSLAERRQQAFGRSGVKWVTDNRGKLDRFVGQLSARLGSQFLACACLPPEVEESKGDGNAAAQAGDSWEAEKVIPRVLVLLSDIEASGAGLQAEIEARDRVIDEAQAASGLPQEIGVLHWSGLWRACFDGKYDFFRCLADAYVLHDRGRLSGLLHLWLHRERTVGKFEKYVAAYVVSGSFVRGDMRDDSDIDVWVVVDDTDVKKMTRSELDDKLRAIIRGLAVEAAQDLEIKDRLHVQTYILTEYWSNLRDANPVTMTFLKDGRPLYDRGIFTAWRVLYENDRIAPPREVISERLRRAREAFGKVKGALFALAEQAVYTPLLNAAQAVLLAYGRQPPTPIKTVSALESLTVMSKPQLSSLQEIIELIDSCKHGGLDVISVSRIDKIASGMTGFLDAADAAVERAYAEGKGWDASREDLIGRYRFWLGEACRLSGLEAEEEDEFGSGMMTALAMRGAIDPGVFAAHRALLDQQQSDRTVVPDARGQAVIEFATRELAALREKVGGLEREQLARNRLAFSYGGDERGEIVFCGKDVFVVHNAVAPEDGAVSRISLREDDYGQISPSGTAELSAGRTAATSGATAKQALQLTAGLLRAVKRAVGDDPVVDLSR